MEKLQRVNTEELVDELEKEMRAALDLSGGKITYDKLPDAQGNKSQLRQLFQNLINNAMKYKGLAVHLISI